MALWHHGDVWIVQHIEHGLDRVGPDARSGRAIAL
jgi:hypothetical protein